MKETKMLDHLLHTQRTAIIEKWYDLVLNTYAPETKKFFKNQKKVWSNPVGAALSSTIERLYDWLLEGPEATVEQACSLLDDVVRIRAVQEFSAAHAVGFVFMLKKAVREVLGAELRDVRIYEELLRFESRVDELALLAFDIYTHCREKLNEIRCMELRNRTSRLLERACQKWGMPSEW